MELTKVDIPIPKVEFNFAPIEVIGLEDATRTGTFSTFEFEDEVSIAKLGSEVAKYDITYFTAATCKSASIRVYSTEGKTGTVKDLNIVTDGASPLSLTIPPYTLGDTYDDSSLATFAGQLLFKLLTQPAFKLKVTGETDLEAGSKVAAEISIADIVVTVKLIP